jgi:hypothetical protein
MQFTGDVAGVQSSGAAEGEEAEVARIVAAPTDTRRMVSSCSHS